MSEVLDNLEFEPVSRRTSCGNEIQLARTIYKDVVITERTFFPWNFFKQASTLYIVSLVLPVGAVDCLDEDYGYTDEGYGLPVTDSLEKALAVIDDYRAGKFDIQKV